MGRKMLVKCLNRDVIKRLDRRNAVKEAWINKTRNVLGQFTVCEFTKRGCCEFQKAYLHPSFLTPTRWEVSWVNYAGPYGHSTMDTISECLGEIWERYGQRKSLIALTGINKSTKGHQDNIVIYNNLSKKRCAVELLNSLLSILQEEGKPLNEQFGTRGLIVVVQKVLDHVKAI